jgi:HEAT repeat protein
MRRFNFRITFARLFPTCLVLVILPSLTSGQQAAPPAELVEQFKTTHDVFWKQFEVAKKLVTLHESSFLQELEPYLKDDDRHVRGNAAFVFAGLGNDRGFEVIKAILEDRSDRPRGVIAAGNWSLAAQIRSDRYYAAHLFGDLKEARAVPILIPLLKDPEVNYIVPWSLGQIGDKSAIRPLIETLGDKSPDMRVLAIYALENLMAKEALPQLHGLLGDNEKIHFDGLGSVAEAARAAIEKLSAMP